MMRLVKISKWQLTLTGTAAAGLIFLFIQAQPVDPDIHDLVAGDLSKLQAKDSELGEAVLQIHYQSQHNYDGVISIMREMQLLGARLSEHHRNRLLPDTPQIRQALSTMQQQIEQKQNALEQFKSDNATLNNAFIYIPRMVLGVFELLPKTGKAATLQHEILESMLRDALLTKVNPGNPLYYSILSQDIRRVEIVLPNLPERVRVLAENAAHHARIVLSKGADVDGLLKQLSSFGKNHIGIEIEQRYLDYYHVQQQSAAHYRLGLFLAAILLLSYAIFAFYRLQAKGRQLEITLADLQEANQRFNQISGNIREVFWMTDATKGEILYVSPAYQTIWGRSVESCYASPQNWMDAIHIDDRQRIMQDMLTKHASGTYDEQFRIVRPDGSIRWIHSRAFPVHNSDGEVYRIVGVADDITERHQIEYELRDFTARLERSNRELQDFATVASHDLQEPLRKIQTFGERLQTKHATALNEEGRDYLARMQDAALRMRALIDDLLTYSRVTAKAQPFTPVDLNKVVEYVLDMLEISITRSGARIEVAELITLDAELVQMRQLLQNLISNALKFHRPGQVPRIKVYGRILNSTAVFAGAQTGTVYQLVVEDQGIGFEEKYLDRIFNLFQRLHGHSEYEGSGVGLAVCRKIAEHHGGLITAISKPGAGAAFITTLPIQQPKGASSHDEK